ncbi:MAG: hypothetical protein RBT78_08215 [Kiritimatiellia bacterium]|nr:hypothetical protein [Kiritimatiellia bacterium]
MRATLTRLIQRFALAIAAGGLLLAGAASVASAAPQPVGGLPNGMMINAPFVSLGVCVAQHPEVLAQAGKLGLKGADKVADGIDAIQDSPYYIPVDAGMGITQNLSEEIEKALEKGQDIGELLDKHKDSIKSAGDKIKVITLVLKGLKVAHLTGHVIEAYQSGDRERFAEALNNAVKEGLKMGGDAAGSWAGGALGAKAGAAIGVWFGGVGAIPGAIIGGAVGSWLGGKAGEAGAEWINDNFVKDSTRNLADWAFDKKYGPPLLPPPLSGGSSGTFGSGGGSSGKFGGSGSSSQAPPKLKAFR